MREAARWQDKVEVQLDNRQLYFLFFGTAVAACLVFTVGVLVGKRLEAGARPAAAQGDHLAALDQLDATGLGKAMAVRAETPPAAAGQADEGGLTFHRTLVDPKGKAAADPLSERGKPGKVAAGAAAQRDRRAPGARAEAVADDEERALRDRYIVQLKAVPSQAEAEALVRKLSATGHRPYLVSSTVAGKGVTYRVRLGEFPSRRAAETAKAEFESRERTVAYVTKVK
ncbi:MAG: SPOR domain-containing protein [Deltaproteobacteria bacterium]|nr:SPOR domain-containing protein [Deltaproteobacteria bacterium]